MTRIFLGQAYWPVPHLLETAFSADTSNVVVFKDMFIPRLRFLIVILSIFAAVAACAVAADQPPAPPDSKKAVPSTGSPGMTDDKKRSSVPPAAPAGGLVVFIDPATGQVRQPDASEIGGLVTPAGGPAPKAPEPTPIQGPGGAVGVRLGTDSMNYVVVTTAPEGQLDMDCVTGEKAASARVTAAPAPKPKETSEGSVPPRDKQHPQDTQRPQDTQNVKIPR